MRGGWGGGGDCDDDDDGGVWVYGFFGRFLFFSRGSGAGDAAM